MKYGIDLQDLSKRESERTEWKENVADIEDVIKTVVAFSNDYSNLGGGYVVCGAKETKDKAGFQKVEFQGLTSNRLQEVEGKVLSDCEKKVDPPVIPIVDEIPTPDPDKRILVFIVPSTGLAHNYKPSSKNTPAYYVRIGRSTREASGALLRELLVRKKVLEPWDRRVNAAATVNDIDLVILRDYLQTMSLWDPSKGLEDYLSGTQSLSAFVPPLAASQRMTSEVLPRNFGLLIFGSQPTKFFPGAFAILSVYPGEDRGEPFAERTEITGTVVEQAKQIISRLNTETYTAFDKTTPHPNQVKYPRRALQEAVVNALVHRDYEVDQPVRITVFADRVEVTSPGNLPHAVDKEKFVRGKAAPYWRNQTLAFFFNKLQLAQAEGQGIPTIIRTMHEEGCPDPLFEVANEHVTCVLPAHPRHKLMRQLRAIENDIILGNHREALSQLEPLLNNDPYNFRALELYCEMCNLLHTPEKVLELSKEHSLRFEHLNSSTLIMLAETLLLCRNNKEARSLANELLTHASAGRLDENEIKKIAVGIRKMGEDERAIEFLDEAMQRIPPLADHASLLEIRAKSKIELAKRCMDTARNRDLRVETKRRAWERCHAYLDDAEVDLNKALESVPSAVERDFIENDLLFLKKMQSIAKKPAKTHR